MRRLHRAAGGRRRCRAPPARARPARRRAAASARARPRAGAGAASGAAGRWRSGSDDGREACVAAMRDELPPDRARHPLRHAGRGRARRGRARARASGARQRDGRGAARPARVRRRPRPPSTGSWPRACLSDARPACASRSTRRDGELDATILIAGADAAALTDALAHAGARIAALGGSLTVAASGRRGDANARVPAHPVADQCTPRCRSANPGGAPMTITAALGDRARSHDQRRDPMTRVTRAAS